MAESARSRRRLPNRSLAFDEDVLAYLEVYSQQIDRPVSWVIRTVLREWMDARITAEEQARQVEQATVEERERLLREGPRIVDGGK